MRTTTLLTMALVPAALIAQAPGPMNFSERFKAEGPAIEQLLKNFQPEEALTKAEALLPATKPTFDKSSTKAGRMSSFQFSDLARTYHLAGKAAIAAGNWEKGRDYFVKAKEVAQENLDQTTAILQPAIATWTDVMGKGKKALEEGAPRLAELKAKTPLTPDEETELKNFQVHQDNITNGEKVTKALQQDITFAKKELDAFAPMISSSDKTIADEKAETDKELADKKFKGNSQKYLAAILNAKNLDTRATKQEKMNFLYRVQFHANGTPLAPKVKAVIDRVRQDQNPFPAEKASKKKK